MEHLSIHRFLEQIDAVERFDQLRLVRDRIQEEMPPDLQLSSVWEWNSLVNVLHDAIFSRIAAMSEKILLEQGMGEAPVPYSFLLFGSGGRKEQTLWSDQDNGLLYADPPHGCAEEAESYFQALCECLEKGMVAAGYPPCEGNVVCVNPKWRKPFGEYRRMMREWFADPDWEKVRYLLIMADLRCVYGHAELVDALKNDFHDCVRENPGILQHMLSNTLHHKISLGVFGQLIKERYGEDAGGVDIKYGAYIPIVNGVRLLSIKTGLRCTSTQERIERLIQLREVEEELGHDWLEALAIALKLRSATPFQLKDGLYTSRGKLPADFLTRDRMNELKFCLRIGKDLQKYVGKQAGGV